MRPHRSRKASSTPSTATSLRDGTIKHLHTIGHPVLKSPADVVEYIAQG